MQTGVGFFSSMPTALAANQTPAQGVQLGEKKKNKQQPVECFLAPESSNTSLLGGALAVAGTCCIQQPTGFPFQWAPARFWAKDGGEGDAFNNCLIIFFN